MHYLIKLLNSISAQYELVGRQAPGGRPWNAGDSA